ncbi:hypothetical protein RHMOL_Rhmol04G0286700 [Rhododendron molle]|uniref:Uncharacterized protein n=1 Tax=Rhododendron molle TaxID=49168 RepID=A0ACC0P757_RHOML|nr:hypothetical protein RHMOL_Rhmol04G0286700 [Rhododendron molle]
MVKFSKELEAQLIPEWKEAFVNYWQLKKHVKTIKLAQKPKQVQNANVDFGLSIFDPVRAAVSRISDHFRNAGQNSEVIKVKSKITEGEDDGGEQVYETELVQLFSEEDEVKQFFESLDEELNKVNQFYKMREAEFLERGEQLNKQLQTLNERKQILSDRRRKSLSSKSSAGFTTPSYTSSARNSDYSESPTEYCESPIETPRKEDASATVEKNGVNFLVSPKESKTKKGNPTRAISTLTSMLWEDVLKNPKKELSPGSDFINRKKNQCAEKMIRGAFVELYRGLGLLKTYSSLNMVAFTKILKKFDKVSNEQASAIYLQVVKRSYFLSSDKVVRLMDEVESVFTKHYANSDRKKAMKFLTPHQHKDSHMLTFFVGLFTGCFVTLFSVYGILAHLCGMFSPTTSYMETVYPVFSMFALLSLHLFMYGCNLFLWKSSRINYNFIFEFQPSTALKYRDAFLICTSLMTAVVAAMVIHLVLLSSGFSPQQVDAIPGILLLMFITLLICPLNILYRSTRFCFLRVMRNIVFSPFYKVLMVDFFMADQLTSQIPLLRYMESTACYIIAGSFKTNRHETCKSGKFYREAAYFISFAPYFWRAMQCARRWYDESDTNHLANMGKYVSAMVAAGARLTYAQQPDSKLWMAIVLVTSLVATMYQLYWDFVKDWGLLNPKSKNPWLRDDLIVKNKSIYYVSIAFNFVLRIAWVETVMRFNMGQFESRLLEFFLASLEVIRRGHWNFYRLENEHLNNVGKFRAVKAVPLPFRYTDSD